MKAEDERLRLWRAHCERMAEATYAVADWCEDLEMMQAYLSLASKWLLMAETPPSPHTNG